MTRPDRNAWLASYHEAALEPDLPLCDPHHHLWDHPGSRYLLPEFLQDLGGGHRVVSTIFVECLQFYHTDGPPALRPVGETAFVASLAGPQATGSGVTEVAAGIVGFADLTLGEGVQPVLEAHRSASGRLRGVRHASAWDASDEVHNAYTHPPPDLLQRADFRCGLACLQRAGLVFDAWLYHPQLAELQDVAQCFPDLPIVLNHMAGPIGIGPYAGRRDEVFSDWRKGMRKLAACPNVCVKLGGRTMTLAGFGWHRRETPASSAELAQACGPYYHACIEAFGPERCMFESNFPVDKASCSYTTLWNMFKRVSSSYSPVERAALLHDTATRVYRLNTPRGAAA